MNDEIKINKANKSLTFINNGIAFSQFGIADEILDLITNLQRNYDRIYNENCKLREEHNITDISLLDENYKLQQENERLKEKNKQLKENNKDAIMYIIGHRPYEDREYLINILQNGVVVYDKR